MTTPLVAVTNPVVWEVFKRRHPDVAASGEVATDSPVIIEGLIGQGRDYLLLEGPTRDDAAANLGWARRMMEDWFQVVDTWGADLAEDLHLGRATATYLWVLFSALMFREWQLTALLESGRPVVCPHFEDLGYAGLAGGKVPLLDGPDANYMALVAREHSPHPRLSLTPMARPGQPDEATQQWKEGKDTGDFGAVSWRIIQLVSLAAPIALGFLGEKVSRVWPRVRSGPLRRTVFHYVHSFMARTLGYAAPLHGVAFKPLVMPPLVATDPVSPGDLDDLTSRLAAAVPPGLPPWADLAARIAGRRLAVCAVRELGPLAGPIRDAVRKWAGRHPGALAVVTTGLTHPVERLVGQSLMAEGVAVIGFSHGGRGRTADALWHEQYMERDVCHGYVFFTPHDLGYCRRNGLSLPPFTHVQGAHRSYGASSPRISRRLIRNHWGISVAERVLLFVPSTFIEDYQRLGVDLRDGSYWLWLRKMVQDVLGQCPWTVVVKAYGKGSGGWKTLAYDPWKLLVPPPNVRVRWGPEFNYSRHTADLMVLDRCESTLNWAAATGKPLVFLDTPWTKLQPEVAAGMKGAFFYFNTAEPNWQPALIDFLALEPGDIARRWARMTDRRAAFLDRFVLGPRRPGSALWRFVAKVSAEVGPTSKSAGGAV